MKANRVVLAGVVAAAMLTSWTPGAAADTDKVGSKHIKHVLLLSIDGMHAVDFYNCTHGIAGANGGDPYCPNMAALGRAGITYVGASSSKPSDSFPGIAALVTGGTPKSTGVYYDESYDRTLFAPGSNCVGPAGIDTHLTESIDVDQSKLNAGGKLGQPLTQIDPAAFIPLT